MGHLKNWIRKLSKNPFEKKINSLKQNARILFFWNRGLGDIPLELFILKKKLLEKCPNASLEVVTRKDLAEGFLLLGQIKVHTSPLLIRHQKENHSAILEALNLDPKNYDLILKELDPAYWFKKERGTYIPKLQWSQTLPPVFLEKNTKPLAFLHLNSETTYGFEKNLNDPFWEKIIHALKEKGYTTVALGGKIRKESPQCSIDLRGKTTLKELVSLILHHPGVFIGPDSGILNILYYLDIKHPLYLISYWANTDVGILRQKVDSPNPYLVHHPIIAPNLDLSKLSAEDILQWIP